MVDELEDNGNGKLFQLSLSKQTRNFSWKIENVDLWPLDTKKTTPYFSPEPNLKFCAVLQTKKIRYDTNIYLSFEFKDGDGIHIHHIASVTDSAENVLHNFNEKSYMYGSIGEVCELDPCPLDKLLENSKDQVIIFNWTVEFVRFTKSMACNHTKQATSMQASVNVLNLTKELKKMYLEAHNTDTILKVGNVDIPVHRCILSQRSPGFAKLFEEYKTEYHIPDLQPSVLQGLVEFLYSANLHSDDFESVHDLYSAAYIYQVDDLRTTCISILLSKLDVGNACRALGLAHDHQDIDFKKSVLDFILSRFTEIVKTTAFKQFLKEKTGLAAEVMEAHIGNNY